MNDLKSIFSGLVPIKSLLETGTKSIQKTGLFSPSPEDSIKQGICDVAIKEQKEEQKPRPILSSQNLSQIKSIFTPSEQTKRLTEIGEKSRFIQFAIGANGPLKVGGPATKAAVPIFKGLKNLSTKLLEKFRGLPNEIKPGRFEEIVNLAKKGGIKEVDETLVRSSVVKNRFGNIDLSKTAMKVEEQLVPLTPTQVKSPRWSSIGEDFIGDGKYEEIVFQSPIKTSAGDVHFEAQYRMDTAEMGARGQGFPNYFSHVRREVLPDGKGVKYLEWQSDLMQKGSFEIEFGIEGDFSRFNQGNKIHFSGKEYTIISNQVKRGGRDM